jgi:lipopolysaccharide/colanic/teichoic acid biosynthesis glycosyltransferase
MKHLIDAIASAFGLVVLAPVMALVAVAIVLDSPGPVFFRQERVGLHGCHFKLWKFRTMQANAAQSGPMLTERGDPRITRVGRRLRRWKIDEFPQLINVLVGEMSLVGPRPELPQLVALYTERERQVLTVRPGITGPSQLAFRDEEERVPLGVDIVRYHVEHILRPKLGGDLAYVEQHSTCGDLGILFQTLIALARRG